MIWLFVLRENCNGLQNIPNLSSTSLKAHSIEMPDVNGKIVIVFCSTMNHIVVRSQQERLDGVCQIAYKIQTLICQCPPIQCQPFVQCTRLKSGGRWSLAPRLMTLYFEIVPAFFYQLLIVHLCHSTPFDCRMIEGFPRHYKRKAC